MNGFKMKLAIVLSLGLSAMGAGNVVAAEKSMTLQAESVVCFSYSSWKEMLSAFQDNDESAADRLVRSGDCRMVTKAMPVTYLDPAAGGLGALIQLPSGKTGYTANGFLK